MTKKTKPAAGGNRRAGLDMRRGIIGVNFTRCPGCGAPYESASYVTLADLPGIPPYILYSLCDACTESRVVAIYERAESRLRAALAHPGAEVQ